MFDALNSPRFLKNMAYLIQMFLFFHVFYLIKRRIKKVRKSGRGPGGGGKGTATLYFRQFLTHSPCEGSRGEGVNPMRAFSTKGLY